MLVYLISATLSSNLSKERARQTPCGLPDRGGCCYTILSARQRLISEADDIRFCGPLAQLVEHRTFNPGVAGSSPARLTILSAPIV